MCLILRDSQCVREHRCSEGLVDLLPSLKKVVKSRDICRGGDGSFGRCNVYLEFYCRLSGTEIAS
jgi:hypothetical protein